MRVPKAAVTAALIGLLAGGGAAGGQGATRGAERSRAAVLLAEQGKRIVEGHAEEAVPAIEEALGIYRAIGDRQGEAAALLLRAMSKIGIGDEQRAIADLDACLALLAMPEDGLTAAMALWMAAELEKQEERLEAAASRLEQSLRHLSDLEAAPAGVSFETFKLLGGAFGAPTEMIDQLGPMLALVAPVLARFLSGANHDSLGSVLTDLGRWPEAEAELREALAISKLFGGFLDSSVYAHLGDLQRRPWRLAEARESYEKALAGLGVFSSMPFATDRRLDVTILDSLAELEVLAGDFEAALAANERAQALVRRDHDRRQEARVLQQRSALLKGAGRFQEAEQALTQALPLARETHHRYREATLLGDLGSIAFMRGSYGQAASWLEQSLAVFRTLDEPYVEAPLWVQLAEVYWLLESTAEVRVATQRAQELAQKSGFPAAAALARAIAELVPLSKGAGSLAEAGEQLQEACLLTELRTLPWCDSPQRFIETSLGAALPSSEELETWAAAASGTSLPADMTRVLQPVVRFQEGRVLFEAGDTVGARRLWQQALGELATAGQRDLCASLSAAIGVTYWKEGKRAEAISKLREAIEGLEVMAGEVKDADLLASFLGSNRRWFYDLLIDWLVAEGRAQEAFAYSERARARSLLNLLGNQRLPARGAGDPALLAQADGLRAQMAAWEAALPLAPPAEREKLESDLAHARASHQSLLLRAQVSNPEYASLVAIRPLDAAAVQAALPPDTALVSYFLTPLSAHAWVLDRATLHHLELPLAREEQREILCLAGALQHPAGDLRGTKRLACAEDPKRGAALYSKLFAPLLPHLPARHLVLVPHGPLHYLPFAALRNPATGHYLVEDYTLTYAPSASVLPFLRGKESRVEGRVLVLGAPETADPRLPALDGAAEEAQQVAALFGTKARLGKEATEGRLYAAAGKVRPAARGCARVLPRPQPSLQPPGAGAGREARRLPGSPRGLRQPRPRGSQLGGALGVPDGPRRKERRRRDCWPHPLLPLRREPRCALHPLEHRRPALARADARLLPPPPRRSGRRGCAALCPAPDAAWRPVRRPLLLGRLHLDRRSARKVGRRSLTVPSTPGPDRSGEPVCLDQRQHSRIWRVYLL